MIRRGALTLGAVLILGGGTGARGDDLSGPVAVTTTSGTLSSWGGVLPTLPENWSDLPVRFKVSESVGYNSNVLNYPTNFPAAGGFSKGDFQSSSSYGASTKINWSGQQIFMDGSVGLTRYLHDVSLNSIQYNVDAGVNWTYTSRCSGVLVASESKVPSMPGVGSFATQSTSALGQPTSQIPSIAGQQAGVSTLGQQVGFGFINFVTVTSFDEKATCRASGDYSLIFNSGISRSTNSTVLNRPNDYRSVFASAGVRYSVAETDSLEALVTVTGTDYNNRSVALNNLGLVNNITQDQFNLTYTKQFSPKLNAIVSVGAVGVSNSSFNLSLPSGIVPQYSVSVLWLPTPRVSVTASAARTVNPPQSVIGNAQITESASLTMAYQLSPKMSLSAGVLSALSNSAFTQFGGAVVNGVAASTVTSENSYGAHANLSYAITPFLGANLNYQYLRTVQGDRVTPQSLVMLNVNYSPY